MCEDCDTDDLNPWRKPEIGSVCWWDKVDAAWDRVKEERVWGDD